MSVTGLIALTLFACAGVLGALDLSLFIIRRRRINIHVVPRIIGDLALVVTVILIAVMFAVKEYRYYPVAIASTAWLGIGAWGVYLFDRATMRRYRARRVEEV